MKRLVFPSAVIALLLIAFAIPTSAQNTHRHYPLHSQEGAQNDGRLRARPGVFDPDQTGSVLAQWRPQIGLPDDRGNANFALYLAKNAPTATNAAAGALIDGVQGITVNTLGYDIQDGGQCGAGAPRFDVITNTGDLYFVGGCLYGTRTLLGGGWTRVVFTAADAFNASTGLQTGIPSDQTVVFMSLLLDEGTDQGPGFAVLDNINVNGQYITKPGPVNTKVKSGGK